MLLGFSQDLPACVDKWNPTSRTLPSFPAPAPIPKSALVICTTPALVFGGCFPALVPVYRHLLNMPSLQGSSVLYLASNGALSPHRRQCSRVSGGQAIQPPPWAAVSVSCGARSQKLSFHGSCGQPDNRSGGGGLQPFSHMAQPWSMPLLPGVTAENSSSFLFRGSEAKQSLLQRNSQRCCLLVLQKWPVCSYQAPEGGQGFGSQGARSCSASCKDQARESFR